MTNKYLVAGLSGHILVQYLFFLRRDCTYEYVNTALSNGKQSLPSEKHSPGHTSDIIELGDMLRQVEVFP